MYDLNVAWSAGGNGVATDAQFRGGRGFTGPDMKALQDTHRCGVAERGWGRAQFAVNEFSQYLAIWDAAAADGAAPNLAIIRFDKTGTYALLIDGKFVATDTALDAILPILTAAAPKASLAVTDEIAEA